MKLQNPLTYVLLGSLVIACGGGTSSTTGGSGADSDGGAGASTGGGSEGGGSESSGAGGSGGTGGEGGGASGSGGSGTSGAGDAGPADDGGSPDDGGATPEDGGASNDGGAGDADAAPPPGPAGILGYTFGSKESEPDPYAPPAAQSYNASGGDIVIDRTGVGVYKVQFVDLDTRIENAQATAFGHDGYCVPVQFDLSSATVRCYDNNADAADAKFALVVLGEAETDAHVTAYAFADQAYEALYDANADRSFNSAGGDVVAQRSAQGTYTVELTDLDLSTGIVQVSAVDTTYHCNIAGMAGNLVGVQCYNNLGQLDDAPYLVMVAQEAESDVAVLGYTRSLSSTADSTDLTDSIYTFSAAGGTVASERLGAGHYKVTFSGLDLDRSHPQVSASSDKKHCGITAWAPDSVEVTCYGSAGTPSDHLFSLVIVE